MMRLPAPHQIAQNLHESNSRLGAWLSALMVEHLPPGLPRRAATPQQMAGLLSELMRAGEWLRSLPHDQGPELEMELSEYRKNVERLRGLMPSIHDALLQERARLEQERGRVEAAANWALSSRQTL